MSTDPNVTIKWAVRLRNARVEPDNCWEGGRWNRVSKDARQFFDYHDAWVRARGWPACVDAVVVKVTIRKKRPAAPASIDERAEMYTAGRISAIERAITLCEDAPEDGSASQWIRSALREWLVTVEK